MAYLSIGETVVTAYIVQDNFSVTEERSYEETTSDFVNVYGDSRKKRIGTKVTISCDLTGVPADIAGEVVSACNPPTDEEDEDAGIEVTYSAPVSREAVFTEGKTTSTLSYESNGDIYDIHVELSGTVPLDGL